MSKFEFVTVVVSIVMAFAISEILAGLGRLVRARSRVDFYWVHVSWMLYAVLWMLLHWWGLWDYREVGFTGFFTFLALVVPSLTFVLLAFLLSPTPASGQQLDLRAWYYRNRGWLFVLGAVVLVELTLLRTLLTGEPVLHPRTGFRVLGFAIAIGLAISRDPRWHASAAIAAWAGIIVYAVARRSF